MKTIALMLVLGAEPPPPIDVRVSLDVANVPTVPCAAEAPKADDAHASQFCAHRARVVHLRPRETSLTSTLEVYDAESGAKLHSVRVFGGLQADADRVYWRDTDYVTRAIDLKNPKAAPKKLGKNECGGVASPSAAAVANGVALCVTSPDQDEKQELLLEGNGVCRVPPAAYKEAPGGYVLATEQLSKACRKMLKR